MADAKPDLIPEKPRIHAIRHAWDILALAVKKFSQIDGAHWAGAFAHYAFFALFPLIVLFVTIASLFIDRDRAGTEVIAYVKTYVPISGEMQKTIFSTLAGVVKARKQAGAIAFVILVLTAMQFFTALIAATNRAWGTTMNSLWRLPLKSLMMLGITIGVVLLGLATPVVMKLAKTWLLVFSDPGSAIFTMANFFIPLIVVFSGLTLFYRLGPHRVTRFAEVWVAALVATILLRVSETLFIIYLRNFAMFNVVYGTFGGIMALLLWIYISGCILIFGACLCAAGSAKGIEP